MAATPSVTTMTSSSSAKMTLYVSINLTKGMRIPDAEVRDMWVRSPSRLKVPDKVNLLSIPYNQEGLYGCGCEDWLVNCLNEKEGNTIKPSTIDGQPQVVNLDGPDMLRVGNWGHLEDPYKHQGRHML